ncbi:unnamed protein product [Camellia sinensis]
MALPRFHDFIFHPSRRIHLSPPEHSATFSHFLSLSLSLCRTLNRFHAYIQSFSVQNLESQCVIFDFKMVKKALNRNYNFISIPSFDAQLFDDEREHARQHSCVDMIVYKRAVYRRHDLLVKACLFPLHLCFLSFVPAGNGGTYWQRGNVFTLNPVENQKELVNNERRGVNKKDLEVEEYTRLLARDQLVCCSTCYCQLLLKYSYDLHEPNQIK